MTSTGSARHLTLRAESAVGGTFHVRELDGLRFLAFFLVFVGHALLIVLPEAAGNVADRLGWIGVDLFFGLSGYLITTLLVREQIITGDIGLRRFWLRRMARIWPLYYLALALGFFVVTFAIGRSWGDVTEGLRRFAAPMVLFVGNWAIALKGWPPSPMLSPLWSISVEEQFYILWPITLLVLGARRAFHVAMGIIVVAPALRLVELLTVVHFRPAHEVHILIHTSTTAHVDVLAAGCALALIVECEPALARRIAELRAWPSLIGAILLAFAVALVRNQDGRQWATQAFGYSLVALGTGALLAGVILGRVNVLSRVLSSRPLVAGGRISYGLYVYHYTVMVLLWRAMPRGGSASAVVLLPSALAITIAVAIVSYMAIERPVLRFKSRWQTVITAPP